ncbi:hypothetical protein OR1_01695 [Geobacter sp. OR-1]|uniref:DotU family type IV/VI secretion system protein n=1 Tax=Geobacter sp. OR-1 TaxID=1266765 RepID=UPI000541F116|nr:DotU family type IV/VI secretion system protein [Geobacter sp. OR-1]GAM09417.1 hypothetical protein OR1_01695 [Geobacter sp. OR-1]
MRLTDCFIQLIVYICCFRKNAERSQPSYDQVRTDVMRLLADSSAIMKQGGFSPDDYDLARFMVCAWVDEVILSSNWSQKNLWQREQLQRVHYNTVAAGEEAFDKLNSLGFHQTLVREVYYLCLALGFKGRFIHPGDEYLLEQLKVSNLKLLMGSAAGSLSLERVELFPDGYPSGAVELPAAKRKFSFSVPVVISLAAPVALLAILYVIYRFALSGIADNFLRTVA